MKKIIIWASIIALSVFSLNYASANNHDKMLVNIESEYGMFTDMVRNDLTDDEKLELKTLVEQQAVGMKMMMWVVEKVKIWELNNFEEFAKIAPKRKAMIDKLKIFMKDEAEFEYMCMNHWDDLIWNLFSDINMVSKYKSILEEKHKSRIEAIYSEKGKVFEKMIHMLYHKNIDDKKIQNISIIRALELIVEDIKTNKFWDFTKFAKKDLSDLQKKALLWLIEERKLAMNKFNIMLTEAKENWNFEEVFEIVQNKRAGCKARFSLYLDETKLEAFEIHCKTMWENLKASFMN